MTKSKPYFVLFANCVPVSGAKKFIICDLALNRYIYIPEFIFVVFTTFKNKSINQIKRQFDNKVNEELDNYLHFLNSNDWGFFSQERKQFPDISFKYESPFIYNNAILDFDENSKYDLSKAIRKIDQIGCPVVQLRFFNKPSLGFLVNLLNELGVYSIIYLEIVLKSIELDNLNELKKLFISNPRLRKVYLHNQNTSEIIEINDELVEYGKLILLKSNIDGETSCGKISRSSFISDVVFFSESKNYNNCLNRKISVDKAGLVKNCPSMKFDFGKIEDVNLLELQNNKQFNNVWSISKDKIDVCKDCEFRYICTDCRAYTVSDKKYSKPLKCSYNPYEGTWHS